MDAREAETKKREEQRSMEKDQSKDGSESSTSQPKRSEAERNRRKRKLVTVLKMVSKRCRREGREIFEKKVSEKEMESDRHRYSPS